MMGIEFGFCPACGAPRTSGGQAFCDQCGATLPAAAQPAPPEALAATPPVAPPGSLPQESPRAGTGVSPGLLLIGVVVVAIVGVAMFVAVSGKSNNSGGGPGGNGPGGNGSGSNGSGSNGSGSLTFSPSQLDCADPVDFTTTVRLPASVHAGDTITVRLDGQITGSYEVSASSRQADGSWLSTSPASADHISTLCVMGGARPFWGGTHTEQLLDSNGDVLAQGSYTVINGMWCPPNGDPCR